MMGANSYGRLGRGRHAGVTLGRLKCADAPARRLSPVHRMGITWLSCIIDPLQGGCE